MDCYVKGYYGYKNFGDELLFFGVVKRIAQNYSIETLFIEVGNKHWMEDRLKINAEFISQDKEIENILEKISFVEIHHHNHKRKTQAKYALGRDRYKKLFKFFGGGEVLTDERKFPHDGRNIPLLFNHTVRKGQFVLLGGVAKPHKRYTKLLYKLLFKKAQKIVVRDQTSFQNIQAAKGKRTSMDKVLLHEDFGVEIIKNQLSHLGEKNPLGDVKYILININHKESTDENRLKIQEFCKQYPLHQKIFFPCDMEDDAKEFKKLKQAIPDLIYYNWTEHDVRHILDMFAHCDGGIGCRLHFLLPLKLYAKTFSAIPYAEKIEKLILK